MSKIIIQFFALLLPPILIALPIAAAWIVHLKRRIRHEDHVRQLQGYLQNPETTSTQHALISRLVERIKPLDFSTAEVIVLLVGEGLVLAIFLLSEDIARLYLFGR